MIYQILKNEGYTVNEIEPLPDKNTARCPRKYICSCNEGKIYVAIATTSTQIFYLKRSIEGITKAKEEYKDIYVINEPISFGEYKGSFYVIYAYIDINTADAESLALSKQETYSLSKARNLPMDDELLLLIRKAFLEGYPLEYRNKIQNLPVFNKYMKLLSKEKRISLVFEHGDYTCNNMAEEEGALRLFDFEFYKENQPSGFDTYDYLSSIGKKKNEKEKNAVSIRYRLLNEINKLIDEAEKPRIYRARRSDLTQVLPDFFYNRMDLRYASKVYRFRINEKEKNYVVLGHKEKNILELGVWQTPIEQRSFNILVDYVFSCFPSVDYIKVTYSKNKYKGLQLDNHWTQWLPNNEEDYFKQLTKKTRYNMKRQKRILEENFRCRYNHFDTPIDHAVICKYFELKKMTYGTSYNLSVEQYVKEYGITDAYVLYIEEEIASIVLVSLLGDYAYIENLTYDSRYSQYSIGSILYFETIKRLISRGVKCILLADGKYEYKARFGALEEIAFNGVIERQHKSMYRKLVDLKGLLFKRED